MPRGQTALRRSQRTRWCTEAGNTAERMCSSPALLRAEGAADYLEQLYLREKKALDGMEQGASENKRLAYQRALVQCIQSAREELK